MNVVAYIRVSSRSQDLASQRLAIERFAASKGESITEWYADKASAGTMNRPSLNRLRVDVKAGKISRLYVFRLDRLARTGIGDMFDLVREFKANKVILVSVGDGMDFSNAMGELLIAVLAIGAQMEKDMIRERLAAARAQMELEGRPWGHPPTITGERLEKAKKMRLEGKSLSEIAAAINAPKSTVRLALLSASKTTSSLAEEASA